MGLPGDRPATDKPGTLVPLNPCLAVSMTRILDDGSLASENLAGSAIRAGQGRIVIRTEGTRSDAMRASSPSQSWLLSSPDFRFEGELEQNQRQQDQSAALDLHADGPAGLLTFVITGPKQQMQLDALIAAQRKIHHIDICNTMDVEGTDRNNGLSDIHFMPVALPELAMADVDTTTEFLGRNFAAPILITGMTGGVEQGRTINLNLALAARDAGIPMGVGSQRLALENPDLAKIFRVKQDVPGVFLIGNIGIAQLINSGSSEAAYEICCRAVDMIAADALAIHINVLQEAIQTEGDRDFRGALERIATIAGKLPVPVIVKEVGCGIDPMTATRIGESAVAAIDVGGRGGTSWGWIEGLRGQDPNLLELASDFRDWGLPTGHALRMTRDALAGKKKPQLIATGGIRTGVDVAKTVALGATMAGIGLPLFRAALQSSDAVANKISWLQRGLKTAMLCTGARTPGELQQKIYFTKGTGNGIDSTLPRHQFNKEPLA